MTLSTTAYTRLSEIHCYYSTWLMHGLVPAAEALMELWIDVYVQFETDGNISLYLHLRSRMTSPKIRQYGEYKETPEVSGEPFKLSRSRGRYSIRLLRDFEPGNLIKPH